MHLLLSFLPLSSVYPLLPSLLLRLLSSNDPLPLLLLPELHFLIDPLLPVLSLDEVVDHAALLIDNRMNSTSSGLFR